MLGLGHHEHAGAPETPIGEPLDEPVGKTLGDERGVIDARRGRVDLDVLGTIGGRFDEHERPVVAALREMVETLPVDPEAGEHRARRQRGEGAERVETEPDEEDREVGVVEHRDRMGREERGRLSGRDDDRSTHLLGRPSGCRGEPGREPAVGDTDPQRGRVGAEHRTRRGPDPRREPVVAAVVAGGTAGGEREQAGFLELEAGGQRLHRPGDDLEGPRLLAPVDLADHHPGAAGLRLASRQTGDDALGARLDRRRPHQIAAPHPLAHDDGTVAGRGIAPADDDDRPVAAPDAAGTGHRREIVVHSRLLAPRSTGDGERADEPFSRRAPAFDPHLEIAFGEEAVTRCQSAPGTGMHVEPQRRLRRPRHRPRAGHRLHRNEHRTAFAPAPRVGARRPGARPAEPTRRRGSRLRGARRRPPPTDRHGRDARSRSARGPPRPPRPRPHPACRRARPPRPIHRSRSPRRGAGATRSWCPRRPTG